MSRNWMPVVDKLQVALGVIMIVCLALTIVAFPVALIWTGQPIGNTAAITANIFASLFSAAFFMAFILAMVDQRQRDKADS
jgi:hypothetical protein